MQLQRGDYSFTNPPRYIAMYSAADPGGLRGLKAPVDGGS